MVRRTTAIGAGTSILMHAALLAAIFIGIGQKRSRPRPYSTAAMAIELAPAPSSPASVPHDTPAEKQQPVEPKPDEDLPNIPKVAAAPDAVTVPVTPPQIPQQPQPAPAPPSAAALPPASIAAAPIVAQPKSGSASDQQNWESKVLARLERMKRYPSQAERQGLQDVVYVRIDLDRSGQVHDATVVRSKGYQLLDDAVRDLVARASPLPPLPKSIEGDDYRIVVPVDFFVRN